MDPFTEKLLERTRQRRENLTRKMNGGNQVSQVSPRKRRAPLADTNVRELETPNEREIQKIRESPNKRMCVSPNKHRQQELVVKSDTPAVPSVKTRMQKLATLRAGWDHEDQTDDYVAPPVAVEPPKLRREVVDSPSLEDKPPVPSARKSRLAHLAATINSWEDETNNPKPPQPKTASPAKPRWQPKSGEQAGSLHRPVAATKQEVDRPQRQTCSAAPSPAKRTNVAGGFPAKERPAPAPVKAERKVEQARGVPSKGPAAVVNKRPAPSPVVKASLPRADGGRELSNTQNRQQQLFKAQEAWKNNKINEKVKEERLSELAALRNRWNTGNDQSGEESEKAETKKEAVKRQAPQRPEVETKRLEVSQSHQPVPTPRARHPPDSVAVAPEAHHAVVGTIPSDSEEEEEEPVPAKRVQLTIETKPAESPAQSEPESEQGQDYDSSLDMTAEEENIVGEIDDLLDQAMCSPSMASPPKVEEKKTRPPPVSSPKVTGVRFEETPKVNYKESADCQLASDDDQEEERAPAPVMYSVECYRSQRKTSHKPAPKQVIKRGAETQQRQQPTPQPRPSHSHRREPTLKDKLKMLDEEVSAQQSIIHQTSQALNLIASSGDFKGTAEEIEAEKLLLLATQRRLACLSEKQRLKSLRPNLDPGAELLPSKGTLVISDIKLPLKTDFIFNMGSKQDRQCHYFIVLVRYHTHIIASHLVSSHENLAGDCLPFTNRLSINDLENDFTVDVEVYGMKMGKVEPDKNSKMKQLLLPKRLLKKGGGGGSQSPCPSSPGGPGAVRSSSFTLVGSIRTNLLSIGKVEKFRLSKVPYLSPIEGSLHMKLQCYVESTMEERGFITMFDDVSGFGAWHRRWCALSGSYISYWKYPDDEKRKCPMGSINLRESDSELIGPVRREFCARPNTIELLTSRPRTSNDKDSLTITVSQNTATTKHWLSFDSKEERLLWTDKLNSVVTDNRMWSKDAAAAAKK